MASAGLINLFEVLMNVADPFIFVSAWALGKLNVACNPFTTITGPNTPLTYNLPTSPTVLTPELIGSLRKGLASRPTPNTFPPPVSSKQAIVEHRLDDDQHNVIPSAPSSTERFAAPRIQLLLEPPPPMLLLKAPASPQPLEAPTAPPSPNESCSSPRPALRRRIRVQNLYSRYTTNPHNASSIFEHEVEADIPARVNVHLGPLYYLLFADSANCNNFFVDDVKALTPIQEPELQPSTHTPEDLSNSTPPQEAMPTENTEGALFPQQIPEFLPSPHLDDNCSSPSSPSSPHTPDPPLHPPSSPFIKDDDIPFLDLHDEFHFKTLEQKATLEVSKWEFLDALDLVIMVPDDPVDDISEDDDLPSRPSTPVPEDSPLRPDSPIASQFETPKVKAHGWSWADDVEDAVENGELSPINYNTHDWDDEDWSFDAGILPRPESPIASILESSELSTSAFDWDDDVEDEIENGGLPSAQYDTSDSKDEDGFTHHDIPARPSSPIAFVLDSSPESPSFNDWADEVEEALGNGDLTPPTLSFAQSVEEFLELAEERLKFRAKARKEKSTSLFFEASTADHTDWCWLCFDSDEECSHREYEAEVAEDSAPSVAEVSTEDTVTAQENLEKKTEEDVNDVEDVEEDENLEEDEDDEETDNLEEDENVEDEDVEEKNFGENEDDEEEPEEKIDEEIRYLPIVQILKPSGHIPFVTDAELEVERYDGDFEFPPEEGEVVEEVIVEPTSGADSVIEVYDDTDFVLPPAEDEVEEEGEAENTDNTRHIPEVDGEDEAEHTDATEPTLEVEVEDQVADNEGTQPTSKVAGEAEGENDQAVPSTPSLDDYSDCDVIYVPSYVDVNDWLSYWTWAYQEEGHRMGDDTGEVGNYFFQVRFEKRYDEHRRVLPAYPWMSTDSDKSVSLFDRVNYCKNWKKQKVAEEFDGRCPALLYPSKMCVVETLEY